MRREARESSCRSISRSAESSEFTSRPKSNGRVVLALVLSLSGCLAAHPLRGIGSPEPGRQRGRATYDRSGARVARRIPNTYTGDYSAKNLLEMACGRERANGMIPSYPRYLPKSHTIVTALSGHHGIVANNFYDPAAKEKFSFVGPKTNGDGSCTAGRRSGCRVQQDCAQPVVLAGLRRKFKESAPATDCI